MTIVDFEINNTLFILYILNFGNSEYIGDAKKTSNIFHPILTPEYQHLFLFLKVAPPNITQLKANTGETAGNRQLKGMKL